MTDLAQALAQAVDTQSMTDKLYSVRTQFSQRSFIVRAPDAETAKGLVYLDCTEARESLSAIELKGDVIELPRGPVLER